MVGSETDAIRFGNRHAVFDSFHKGNERTRELMKPLSFLVSDIVLLVSDLMIILKQADCDSKKLNSRYLHTDTLQHIEWTNARPVPLP